MLYTILIIFLVLALFGSLPVFPYSANYGPYPSVGIGTILIIVLLVLFLRG